jgi:hypothetical protein
MAHVYIGIAMKGSRHGDLSKLKIDKFSRIKAVNFPPGIDLGIENSRTPEVLIHFISAPADVLDFVESSRKTKLPQENRVIMVYRKGNKALNRDTIISPFRNGTYADFKLKPPMLCALSDSLSAFVFQKV